MRTNEFFWNYVVSNWYMGRKPAPFDILAWNADQMRLPAQMHAQFLRDFYLENRLASPGAFEIDGTPVDLTARRDAALRARRGTDHIAPWRSVFRDDQLVPGAHRFVLTAGGHIAGMVSPPASPKARHYFGDDCPPIPTRGGRGRRARPAAGGRTGSSWATARSGRASRRPPFPTASRRRGATSAGSGARGGPAETASSEPPRNVQRAIGRPRSSLSTPWGIAMRATIAKSEQSARSRAAGKPTTSPRAGFASGRQAEAQVGRSRPAQAVAEQDERARLAVVLRDDDRLAARVPLDRGHEPGPADLVLVVAAADGEHSVRCAVAAGTTGR